MAILSRSNNNNLLSRLRALIKLQFELGLERGLQAQFNREMCSSSVTEKGHVDISKWKKVDSRKYGIYPSMISSPSWIVLKILRSEGFEAYLVGGCVRDLILNKIPKDYDVITTANLKQIRKKFNRADIVGRRFPICMVHVKGSVIEVSSFETVANQHNGKEKKLVSHIPKGCDEKDLRRWRNSMHRDFTVNSLFFDPFVNTIYDYSNGMMDLKSLKLRTLGPAQISFEEDCARILRGLRIAARLGLTISKDTVSAIHNLSSSLLSLSVSRIMMEMNYMLSYGSAETSLCLLRRFNLLEFLLPFHAAYLAEQASSHASERSMMLMRLFSNLDKIVTVDRPSSCNLWVGLLAFHLALVLKPQDPLVVWTFASVLYQGNWNEGVKYARKHVKEQVKSLPEITDPRVYDSDEELIEKVSQLASAVQASIYTLTEKNSLFESLMSRFPNFPCSGLVFVSKKVGKDVAVLFNVLVKFNESYKHGIMNFEINHHLLGQGNLRQVQFVLGKVILDTVSGGVLEAISHNVDGTETLHTFKNTQKLHATFKSDSKLSDVIKNRVFDKEDKKRSHSEINFEIRKNGEKRQRLVKIEKKQMEINEMKCFKVDEEVLNKETIRISEVEKIMTRKPDSKENIHKDPHEMSKEQKVVKKKKVCQIVNDHSNTAEKPKKIISNDEIFTKDPQKILKKGNLVLDNSQVPQDEKSEENAEKHKPRPLSSFFKR